METMTTNDTYEAAYYLTCGALIKEVKVERKEVRIYEGNSPIIKKVWKFHLINIPKKAIDDYWSGNAKCNVNKLKEARLILKARAKEVQSGRKIWPHNNEYL